MRQNRCETKNSIFANHERARLDMKKQAEKISKKYVFFDDKDDKKNAKIKKESDTEMDENETIPMPHQREKITLMIVNKLSMLPRKRKVRSI